MATQYVTNINRYRDSVTGRFISKKTIDGYIEKFTQAGRDGMDFLVLLYETGEISASQFASEMKDALKTTWIQQAILGRGGRNQMTSQDWGWTGRKLKDEYALIDKFANDLENLSPAQRRARAKNYFGKSRAAYEKMNGVAIGIPTLPAYPCDGTSECMNNCSCTWKIDKLAGNGDYDCYWQLGDTEHCTTCLQRSSDWSPLQVRGGAVQ